MVFCPPIRRRANRPRLFRDLGPLRQSVLDRLYKPNQFPFERFQALAVRNWLSAGSNHQSLVDHLGRPNKTFQLERAGRV
jgi:hypothetical protein